MCEVKKKKLDERIFYSEFFLIIFHSIEKIIIEVF